MCVVIAGAFPFCLQAEQVLEEIVAVGALMQSYWLEPVPPQAASGAGGSGAAAGESTASGGAGQAPAADVSAAGALAADPAAAAAAAAAPAAEARAAAGGSAAGGSAAEPQPQQGGAFRVKKGIDPVQLLPQRLVRTGEWQQWNRRLRDAIIAWQRQAAAEARDQKQAAAAAAAGSADGPAAAGGGSQAAAAAGGAAATAAAAQAGPPQPAQDLQAAFIIHSCTPDEVAMKHELRIKVPRQQGIALRNQVGTACGQRGRAAGQLGLITVCLAGRCSCSLGLSHAAWCASQQRKCACQPGRAAHCWLFSPPAYQPACA